MEYENAHGNKKNLERLKQRVEEYLDKAYGQGQDDQPMEESE